MAHEAVAPVSNEQQESDHDAWFREQVEIGLREADDPNTVWFTQEEVMHGTAELLEKCRERHLLRKAS
ncbi:MAG: hypothetical protein M3R43_06310 [Acidobacteriota bacterium]|nr:hypothetical protein [Acidobacteriota bacterium]